MRLVVKFSNRLKIKPPLREYIRNFIYKSLQESKFNFFHDKLKYKHFCFSNAFPFDKEGYLTGAFKLIISSPYEELIMTTKNYLETNGKAKFGNIEFEVENISTLSTPANIQKVTTATPVIVRLPATLYDKYNIHDDAKTYKFWEEKEVLNAFIDLLQNNSQRKFADYKQEIKTLFPLKKDLITKLEKENYSTTSLFSLFKYKKTIYGWDKHNIGTMWEFHINPNLNKTEYIKFLYEVGLGERNASSGSGFLNVIT